MPEVDLNQYIGETLTKHNVNVSFDGEFIYAELPSPIKLKAKAVYNEINNQISSQLEVVIITPADEQIIEHFGDIGDNVDTVIEKVLTYFNISDLHPLLAAFGIKDTSALHHVDIEEWEINGKIWIAYIGNLIPKTNSPNANVPDQFFEAIVTGIQSQKLDNHMHWFRSYYLQYNSEIISTEFLMDNKNITLGIPLFSRIPVIPNVEYYSCRNFIILKLKS